MDLTFYHRKADCPYCDMYTDRKELLRDFPPFGTPYRTCPKCGRVYFDSGYQEDAIAWFTDTGGEFSPGGLIASLFYNGALIFYIIECIRTKRMSLIGFSILLIIALAFDIVFIRAIWNRIRAKEYHQKIIDTLEGRRDELPPEVAESMKRLSDRGYLDALRSHGVEVPEYFYQRLRGDAAGTFVEPEGIKEAKKIREYV